MKNSHVLDDDVMSVICTLQLRVGPELAGPQPYEYSGDSIQGFLRARKAALLFHPVSPCQLVHQCCNRDQPPVHPEHCNGRIVGRVLKFVYLYSSPACR
jgi:hypothetical protein